MSSPGVAALGTDRVEIDRRAIEDDGAQFQIGVGVDVFGDLEGDDAAHAVPDHHDAVHTRSVRGLRDDPADHGSVKPELSYWTAHT